MDLLLWLVLWRLTHLGVEVVLAVGLVLVLLVGTVRLLDVLHDAADHRGVALPEQILLGEELALVVQVVVAGLVEAVVNNGDAVATAQQLLARTHQEQAVVGRFVAADVAQVVVDVAHVVGRRHRLVWQRWRRAVASLDGSGYGGYYLAFSA